VKNLGVPIKVKGFDASIIRIVPSLVLKDFLTVTVEFKEAAHGLLSFGVEVPAKEYTKDTLIAIVTKEAERRLERYLEEKRKQEEARKEHLRLEELAKKLSAEIGLEF
jgi:DNA topoisomerase VI subunit B